MIRFRYARHCTALEIWGHKHNKEDGMHNKSGNGHGAKVTLQVHPTYIRSRQMLEHQ
jgi:hypothetical protein